MNAIGLIAKKRDGSALNKEEVNFMVQEFSKGRITDYQMSAFLMAVFIKGMTEHEASELTQAMVASGKTLDLTSIPGIKADKHSTGGVGDKTTLVVAPLIASAGIPIAKLSGRALSHTGGTLDKLESIPGIQVDLPPDRFIQQVKHIGIAIASQSEDLVPADKKIYALRDVTATVPSIPLIASSVMSKKLAAGADVIVLDVKVGRGAFMRNRKEAIGLARLMITIGKNAGRKVGVVISDMNQPLGYTVGNTLEVREAVDALQGKGPLDLQKLCFALGTQILILAGKAKTEEEGQKLLASHLNKGKAWSKFLELVEAQGGQIETLLGSDGLPKARLKDTLITEKSGYVAVADARLIGEASIALGAGRTRKGEMIDSAVGIELVKKVGDQVSKGKPLAFLYANQSSRLEEGKNILAQAFQITKEKPAIMPLIYQILR